MSETLQPMGNPLKLSLTGYNQGKGLLVLLELKEAEYKEILLFAIFEEQVKGIAEQARTLQLEGKPLLQFYCAEWNIYTRSADDLDELCMQDGKVYKLAISQWQKYILIPLFGYITGALYTLRRGGSTIDQSLVNTIINSCPDSPYASMIISALGCALPGHRRAAVWLLDTTTIDRSPPIKTTTNATDSEEAVFDNDGRTPVKAVDLQDGGKFRSIAKVWVQFPDKQWCMGTGYLVKNGVVVTAAHNVYNKTRGPAIQIMCYVGYDGRQSVYKKGVQLRHGRKVVTMKSWINESTPCHDVAFIQTNVPFTGNLNLFKFIDTPSSVTGLLGVVGYPGDKDLDGDKGAQMYKLFKRTTYDLKSSGMISYRTSTFGGQSGSPILLKTGNGKLVVIGTHGYGGEFINLGSSIGGNSGNDYKALLELAQGPQTAGPNEIMIVAL